MNAGAQLVKKRTGGPGINSTKHLIVCPCPLAQAVWAQTTLKVSCEVDQVSVLKEKDPLLLSQGAAGCLDDFLFSSFVQYFLALLFPFISSA